MQLQEIGPRFTLKLRSLRKGLPAVKNLGEVSKDLEFDIFEDQEAREDNDAGAKDQHQEEEPMDDADEETQEGIDESVGATRDKPKQVVPPKDDEYVWMWKVCVVRIFSVHGEVELITIIFTAGTGND